MIENIKDSVGSAFGTLLSAVGASMSVTELQAIISIVVTILGFLITLTTALIIPVVKKIKKAKQDGKITMDEFEDIVDTAEKGLEDIKKDNK